MAAVFAGFFCFHDRSVILVIKNWGTWWMAGIFVAWACLAWHEGRRSGVFFWKHWRAGWRPALLITGCTLFLLTREPFGFKVTMDELVLGLSAMSMHFGRVASAVMRGFEVQGFFTDMGYHIDKRPLFFPWLLSVVHDLIGYRPGNVHILNSLLTAGLLALVYRLGCWLRDWRSGLLAVLLMTSLPLLAQNAAGGGFELLNAVMILLSILTGIRYVRDPRSGTQGLFIFTIILLANTRYESAIYVVCAGAVIVGEWWLRRRVLIGWPLLIAPLILVPVPWHMRIFSTHEAFWQLPEGVDKPFGVGFLYDNVGHFMAYALDFSRRASSSPILSLGSVLGLGFLALYYFRKGRELGRISPERLVPAVFAVGMAGNVLLLLSYHWGQVDAYEVSRILLPYFCLGSLAASFVLFEFSNRPGMTKGAVIAILASIYIFTLPATSKAVYTKGNFHARRMEWSLEFHRSLPPGNYLYVSRGSLIFILNQVSAVHIADASSRVGALDYQLKRGTFNGAFVIQNIFIDPDTGREQFAPGEDVGPAYTLEPVTQRFFRPYLVTRISRVVGLDPSLARVKPSEDTIPRETAPLPAGAEMDYDETKLYDQWMKNLP